MIHPNLEQIRAVAHETRMEFQTGKISTEFAEEVYADYNPNLDGVGAFVIRALDTFPSGACGLASLVLQRRLTERFSGDERGLMGSVEYGSYKGQGHTALYGLPSSKGMLMADITADQFGGPAVYVGRVIWPWIRPGRIEVLRAAAARGRSRST